MQLSYKPLFKLLIERGIPKMVLCEKVGFSPTTLAKMGKGEPVYLDIIVRICAYLSCDLTDVMRLERSV